ncbi:cation:proton antiporter [Synechococcus sp. CS-1328]|uniref:cation:proton antiporter domain-containing protein n=1 Tax=Synechococcus sp. CS-1328 TaxID=2847976 RepID=UPI0021E507A5|nr:cation:proton antiporter [Synechococcus sp. CS-1328]MCT0224825.1 cation:proton antiporter [Synechococcus sp. CS-1328]
MLFADSLRDLLRSLAVMQSLLLDLVTIFALSVAAAVVCHRLRLPSAIGLLLAGVIAGPHALQLVRNAHEIELLAEIGVVLLLFVIGLEISIADLERLKRFFAIGGTVQFFGTAAVVTLLLPLTGLVPQQSVYLGFVVALSSTAIVLRVLQERGELETPHGRSILSILIYQDIGVVPVMLTAPLLAGMAGLASKGGGSGLADLGALLLKVLLVAAFGYSAYRWIVPWVLERITRTRSSEAFLLGVFMLCGGIAVLTQSLGLSLALGAFLAGFILSESDYSHQAVAVMLPFRDVLMSLFFISIGMLLDLKVLTANLGPMLLLTAMVLLIKPLIAASASLAVGLPLRQSVLSGMALAQVGEFSLVATKAGVSSGLLSQEVFQSVLVVAVLSMLATPLLIQAAPKLAEQLAATPLGHWSDRRSQQVLVGAAPQEAPSVLIVGFGVTGRNLAASCQHCDVPYAVVELNAALVRKARSEGIPIHYGDASQPAILELVRTHQARAIVVVIDDPGAARRIVELARRLAPDAFILVRTRYLREVEPLSQLGADEVIADELEVSIEVFSRVLARMLVPRERIKELIGDVRGEWRQMARSLSPEATRVHDLRVVLPNLATHSIPLREDNPWVGQTIASSRLRDDHGVTVLAVQRSGATLANPRGDVKLQAGDVLFVIGPEQWDPVLT